MTPARKLSGFGKDLFRAVYNELYLTTAYGNPTTLFRYAMLQQYVQKQQVRLKDTLRRVW
jgi:hypothetical protein